MSKTDKVTQDLILKKLEDYGSSFLHENKKKSKAPKHKSKIDFKINDPSPCETLVSDNEVGEGDKTNKKSKEIIATIESVSAKKQGIKKQWTSCQTQLQLMREELKLSQFKSELGNSKTQIQSKQDHQPEIVVFTSYRSNKKKANSIKIADDDKGIEFDMQQARYEVQKFGIKGFQGNQKDEAMTSFLVKLGAKPPKNKYLNYKEYQEKVKQKKIDDKKKKELDRKLGYKIPKATKGKKRPRDKNDIGHLDGQIGRWKAGVQFISKDALKGIKKSKLK